MRENRRFVDTVYRINQLVDAVHGAASQQITFAQKAGEDLWVDLEHVGRVDAGDNHINAWGGSIRAFTTPLSTGLMAMRVETDVPTHDCRRLALYFIGQQTADQTLISIAAQAADDNKWILIYPLSTPVYERAALFACGKHGNTHLAMTFKIR